MLDTYISDSSVRERFLCHEYVYVMINNCYFCVGVSSPTCGLRGGAAATAALIGCWDQVRGARFVGRDRLLPLHRRATSFVALRV